MKKLFPALLIVGLLSVFAAGQAKQTENTLKLANGERGEKATISDMEWLAGTWTGDALGGNPKRSGAGREAGSCWACTV